MRAVLLISILFNFSLLHGQVKENTDIKKIYEFSVSEYPQTVNLTEYKNGDFDGLILTEFFKGRFTNNGFFKRVWKNIWNIKSQKIIDSLEINPALVKELMNILQLEGIETIKDCHNDEECKKINFLDGGSVNFKISTEYLQRKYSFQEIHPYKSDNLEKTKLRQQAQKLVTIIDESLNFKSQFEKCKNRLPKGYYFYAGYGHFFVEFYNKK